MATFTETNDQSLSFGLGDNILGSISGADMEDTHDVTLIAGMTYRFTVAYDSEAGPITLEARGTGETFTTSGIANGGGILTLMLDFVATEDGPYEISMSTPDTSIGMSYDLTFALEKQPQGSTADDNLMGTNLADDVWLGIGDDTMTGRGGDDTIRGGFGEDRLEGGDGDDWINAGHDDDYVIGDAGNDTVFGGSGADTIEGGFGDDRLAGNDGNNVINGGHGNDLITGGNNNDRITAGGGNDRIISGNGNDRVLGHHGDDVINAGDGNDLIHGGAGNDIIISGGGDDDMIGGTGADRFIFATGMDADRIRDFEDGADIMDFSRLGVTSMDDMWIRQAGNHTVVQVDPNAYVILTHTDVNLIDDSDFIFA